MGVVGVVEIAVVVVEVSQISQTLGSQLSLSLPNIKGQSIQTFRQEIGGGVGCISNGGGAVTFVRNPRLVLGRMFTPPNLQNNEKSTNSASNRII